MDSSEEKETREDKAITRTSSSFWRYSASNGGGKEQPEEREQQLRLWKP